MKRYGVLFSLIIVGTMASMEKNSREHLEKTKSLKSACACRQEEKERRRAAAESRARRLLRRGSMLTLSHTTVPLAQQPQGEHPDITDTHHALFEFELNYYRARRIEERA